MWKEGILVVVVVVVVVVGWFSLIVEVVDIESRYVASLDKLFEDPG
jgi:hypothetical protein